MTSCRRWTRAAPVAAKRPVTRPFGGLPVRRERKRRREDGLARVGAEAIVLVFHDAEDYSSGPKASMCALHHWRSFAQLPLLPLGAEAIAELLRDLLGTDPSP